MFKYKFIYKDENQFNKEEITGISNLKNPIKDEPSAYINLP